MLSDIHILIWDFDGTLYRPNPALSREIREAEYQTIIDHTGWTRKKAIEQFTLRHKTVFSATETVAQLCSISTSEAAHKGEVYIDRGKYLRHDTKLVRLFGQLHQYTHYMLVNGIESVTKKTLKILGVDPGLFQEIVTSERVKVNKPNEEGFRYILDKTGYPANKHLMIGDRDLVDLAPAKKLGMKTCIVWTNQPTPHADVAIPTVYDLASLLK